MSFSSGGGGGGGDGGNGSQTHSFCTVNYSKYLCKLYDIIFSLSILIIKLASLFACLLACSRMLSLFLQVSFRFRIYSLFSFVFVVVRRVRCFSLFSFPTTLPLPYLPVYVYLSNFRYDYSISGVYMSVWCGFAIANMMQFDAFKKVMKTEN